MNRYYNFARQRNITASSLLFADLTAKIFTFCEWYAIISKDLRGEI